MRRARRHGPALLAVLALLVTGGGHSARGHGAVIRLGANAVAAGDSLAVTGEGLGVDAAIALRLVGAAFEAQLVTIRGDAHGRFAVRVIIPAGTPPGTYRVVASAGDKAAAGDLLVTAVAPLTSGSLGPAPPPLHATAERIALARRRTAWELAAAAALALLLAAAGVWLAYPDPGGHR
ncbi:MAG: hypothetical protein ABR559_04160 [Gemmatimonadota bacterium]